MGWSSGTDLVNEVALAIAEYVESPKIRAALYEALISAAEAQDWDGQSEVDSDIDPVLNKLLHND